MNDNAYFDELNALYLEVLERSIDPSGYETYSKLREAGTTLSGIAKILRDSSEYALLLRHKKLIACENAQDDTVFLKTPISLGLNDTLTIKASLDKTKHQWSIYLLNDVTNNILLLFKIMDRGRIVVMNTMRNQIWEEGSYSHNLQFTLAQPYEFRIKITSDNYLITIGDQNRQTHDYSFPHRYDFNLIDCLQLEWIKPEKICLINSSKETQILFLKKQEEQILLPEFTRSSKKLHFFENDVDYIMGYRESSGERKLALQFTTSWLYKHFPELQVTIIEQDTQSKLKSNDLPPNCNIKYVYNSGPFNLSWGHNIATKLSLKPILIIGSIDVFLQSDDYLKCFEACLKFDAASPFKLHQFNLKEVSNLDLKNLQFQEIETRQLWTDTGGIVFIHRDAFDYISGFDERFEGWGGEDDAFSYLVTSKLKYHAMDLHGYHIKHDRSVLDDNAPSRGSNRILLRQIQINTGVGLDQYIIRQKDLYKGDIHKYSLKNYLEYSFTQFTQPIIRIVTSFYNVAQWLPKTISSLKNQKFKKWHCYLFDDLSTDDSYQLAQNAIAGDSRFTLIKNAEKNYLAGNCYQLSKLKEIDNDDIMIQLDGDDWLADDSYIFDRVLEAYADGNTLATHGVFHSHENGKTIQSRNFSQLDINNIRKVWDFSSMRTWRMILLRNINKKNYISPEGTFWEMAGDVAITTPIAEMAGSDRIKFIPEVAYIYNCDNELNDHKLSEKLQRHYHDVIKKKTKYTKKIIHELFDYLKETKID